MINFLEITLEAIVLIIALSVFFISGFSIFYYPKRNYDKIKKRCSVPIEAEVIGHDVKQIRHDYLYANIYKYYYNGQEYQHIDPNYNNLIRGQIGSRVQIMINPQNPYEILSTATKIPLIVTTIMGLLIMGVPAFIGFLYLLDFLF